MSSEYPKNQFMKNIHCKSSKKIYPLIKYSIETVNPCLGLVKILIPFNPSIKLTEKGSQYKFPNNIDLESF